MVTVCCRVLVVVAVRWRIVHSDKVHGGRSVKFTTVQTRQTSKQRKRLELCGVFSHGAPMNTDLFGVRSRLLVSFPTLVPMCKLRYLIFHFFQSVSLGSLNPMELLPGSSRKESRVGSIIYIATIYVYNDPSNNVEESSVPTNNSPYSC